jgi:Zn/Cd-binding protein ZinT
MVTLTLACLADFDGSWEAVFPLEPREMDKAAWSDLLQQKAEVLLGETAEV